MKTTSIKKYSESLWKEGDFQGCYNKAIELPVVDFISFIRDNKSTQKNFLKGKSGHHFWKLWILETPKFNEIFSLPESADLLLEYFISHNINSEFLIRIAQHNPQLFIDALRTNQVFLKDNHWPTLLEIKNMLPPNVTSWVTFLDRIRLDEQVLWKEVVALQPCWRDFEPIEVITYAALWYEKHKIDPKNRIPAILIGMDSEDNQRKSDLRKAVNIFLSFYLSDCPKPKQESIECILEKQVKVLEQVKNNEQNPIFTTLDKIKEWGIFEELFISPIAHDLNFDIRETENAWYFSPKAIASYIKWQSEGNKYNAVYHKYFLFVDQITTFQVVNGDIEILGGVERQEDNQTVVSNILACKLLLKDIGIDCLVTATGKQLPIEAIARLCAVAQTNAFARYIEPSTTFREKYGTDWVRAIAQNLINSWKKELWSFPVRVEDVNEWAGIAKEFCTNNNGIDYTSEALELLAFDTGQKQTFDRFDPKLNCRLMPFIKLGDFVVNLPCIWGEINPIHNIIELALNIHWDKRRALEKGETQKLEENLSSIFKDVGFKFVHNSLEYKDEKGRGDIDVLVFDGKTLLIVEVKRTKPRLTLYERNLEKKMVTDKAIKQLDKAVAFLNDNPTFLRECFNNDSLPLLSEIAIKTLILSTSPEHTDQYHNGHYKALYYEFLFLFTPPSILSKSQSFEDIDTIIAKLKTGIISKEVDYPFKDRGDLELCFLKKDDCRVEVDLRKKGADCYQQKQYKQAILFFERGLELDSLNPWLLEEIGNCHSELKNFEKSIEYYTKALENSPDCWHILLNRSMSYRDLGRHDEELIDILNLIELYGHFNDGFKKDMQDRAHKLFELGKLNADSIERLIALGLFGKG